MRQEIKERIEKIKKGQVPNGYKRTKIGIIPQEWEVEKLGDIGSLIGGGTPSTNKAEYWNGNIPWISSSDLIDGSIYKINKTRFINEEAIKESATKLIPKNSILIVSRVGVGKVAVNNEILCTSQDFQSLIFKNKNSVFLAYLIKLKMKLFIEFNQGTSIKGVVKSDLKNLIMQIPNIKEQTQIASILSTWDIAIEKQEKLIELKKEQKKWLMQELLTGKKRLKGFSGEVKKTKLKGYIIEKSIKNKNNIVTRVLSVTNNRGFINQSKQFERQVASKDTSNYKIIRKNQFGYNPSRVNVGSIDLLRDFEEGILSPIYVIFEPNEKKIFLDYLFQFIKSPSFYGQMKNLLQGSVRDNLSFDSLSEMKLFIPSIQEQKSIAEILSTADKEIDLLEKELEKIKEQKKGLMQLLLTGIVRVN